MNILNVHWIFEVTKVKCIFYLCLRSVHSIPVKLHNVYYGFTFLRTPCTTFCLHYFNYLIARHKKCFNSNAFLFNNSSRLFGRVLVKVAIRFIFTEYKYKTYLWIIQFCLGISPNHLLNFIQLHQSFHRSEGINIRFQKFIFYIF